MAEKEKYMKWIDEFSRASFGLYSGNTISAFQPLDFFHYYGLWYDLWLERIIKAMEKINAENRSYEELKDILPTTSNLRALIQKAIPAYIGSDRSKKELYARYTNFVARMLIESCPEDPFGLSRTPLYSNQKIKTIIKVTNWQPASPIEARMMGKLITAAGSLVHGLYNDVVTDFGWDTYGPFDDVLWKEAKYTMLIRNFSDLQPGDLWPQKLMASIKSFKIYQLYQGVKWATSYVGCHTVVKKGDPIDGLKYYSIIADDKQLSTPKVNDLINELAERAEKIYLEIRKKDFEELKLMVMLQECYQLKAMFEKANIDWKPTPLMIEAVKNKPLLSGILPHDVIMTNLEESKKAFRIYEFEKEVLS